ncbi:ribbon-helix-helix protein, CopG family [Gluconobacter oxydans]|uniref:ribbon-helix-helix protein, CopG family n=1 Tax=Gluconobacter oxydans TaxID=442 RepID=UPI0009BC9D4E
MNTSIKKVIPKRRGRPATGKDQLVGVRLPPAMLDAIARMSLQKEVPRSEVIRRLIQKGLETTES